MFSLITALAQLIQISQPPDSFSVKGGEKTNEGKSLTVVKMDRPTEFPTPTLDRVI